jgi:hypothetical protein
MTSFLCKCGNEITTGSYPNKSGYRLISEKQFDSLQVPLSQQALDRLYLDAMPCFLCSKCGRIILFKRKPHDAFFYKPDPDEPAGERSSGVGIEGQS